MKRKDLDTAPHGQSQQQQTGNTPDIAASKTNEGLIFRFQNIQRPFLKNGDIIDM